MDESRSAFTDTKGLAQKLGLSRWAISRVLNHQPGVGADTRARVLAEVARGGFEPNAHARGLRGVGQGLVGLALPTLRDPVWTPLAAGLCEGLLVRGLQPDLMLGSGAAEGDAKVWTRYAARHATAILILGAATVPTGTDAGAPAAWAELQRRKVPVIFVEPTWEEEPDGLCVVRSDYRSAAALVSGHLRHHGHRRVELCGFGEREQSRVTALRAACEARGLLCATGPGAGDGMAGIFPGPGRPRPASPRTPRPRTRQVAATPTAIVAADDLRALRVLCELRAAGRTVPGTVSLVGYGDDPAGALAAPALTTVDPQRAQLVVRTLEMLDEAGQNPGSTQAGSIWVAPLLRCRASVGSVAPPAG